MTKIGLRLRNHWRIVATIAGRDIVDALKNRTTISVMLGVAMLMLSSQALSFLTGRGDVRLVVYDAGESALVGELRKSPNITLARAASPEELENAVGEGIGPMVGLLLPAGLDDQIAAGRPPVLEGLYPHWAKDGDVARAQTVVESELTQLTGQPVRLVFSGKGVYPSPDAEGQPFVAALSLSIAVLTMCVILVPYLIVEEKENRTLDALLVSPATIPQVTLGKGIAGMVYGLAAAAVVLFLQQGMVVHWGWVMLVTLCGALFAVALGLLMGTLFENTQAMSVWTGMLLMGLLLPMILTDPSLSVPRVLASLSPWIPSVALAASLRATFAESVPLALVLPRLGVLLASSAVLLGGVVWLIRRFDR
jgi:ABC-2 type transport system permease protein